MSKDPILPNGFTVSQVNSCTSRGVKTGYVSKQGKCGGCSASNRETVYKCSVHELCTINKAKEGQSQWVCSTCVDVTPKEN